jgi:hypothetical protein
MLAFSILVSHIPRMSGARPFRQKRWPRGTEPRIPVQQVFIPQSGMALMSGLSDSPASTQQNTLWKERFPRLFTDHPIPFRRQNNGDYRDKHPLAPHLGRWASPGLLPTRHLAELSILRPGPPRNCEGLKNHGGRRFPFCAGAVKRRPRGHRQPVFLLAKNCQDRSDSHLGQPPGGLAGQWFETASQNRLADHLVFT